MSEQTPLLSSDELATILAALLDGQRHLATGLLSVIEAFHAEGQLPEPETGPPGSLSELLMNLRAAHENADRLLVRVRDAIGR